MDSSCPACDFLSAPMLAIVSYPTTQETEQNWEKLTDPEKRELLARKRWLAAWQAASPFSTANGFDDRDCGGDADGITSAARR